MKFGTADVNKKLVAIGMTPEDPELPVAASREPASSEPAKLPPGCGFMVPVNTAWLD